MTINVTISLNDKNARDAVRKFPSNFIRRRGEALADIGSKIQINAIKYAYQNAKYAKTGSLAASIKLTVNAAQGFARVFASGYKKGKWDIPAIVEYGQKSHSIPKNPYWGRKGKLH